MFVIFRKDVKHHWPEILISIFLLAAFSWRAPRDWEGQDWLGNGGLEPLWNTMPILLLLSWGLLVVRVVQGESLVGDRQFWITRPYEWKKLISEKVLFIAVFIGLPLIVADVVLLMYAGFRPEPAWIHRLIGMQLTLIILLIVIAALAAITATLVQMLVALLGIGVAIAGAVMVVEYFSSAPGFDSIVDWLSPAIMIAASIVILLMQYARRTKRFARTFAIAATLIIAALAFAAPYLSLAPLHYPLLESEEAAPVKFALSGNKPGMPEVKPDNKRTVDVELPIEVSRINSGSLTHLEGTNLSLEGPNGSRWQSHWVAANSLLFPDESSTMRLSFSIDKRFYERVASGEVRARLEIAYSLWRDQGAVQTTARERNLTVPGYGYCSLDQAYSSSLRCRTAFSQPAMVVVRSDTPISDCRPTTEGDEPAATSVRGWTDDDGTAFISPIEMVNISLRGHPSREVARLCPGSPLTFSFPEKVRQVRIELDLGVLRIADYRKSNVLKFGKWR
jgi:hypothetical protein